MLLVICSLILYNSSIITRLAKEVHLMSIQNAGKTIRDARISPVTFQALMTRAGAPSEI